jgi:hypothetical protein
MNPRKGETTTAMIKPELASQAASASPLPKLNLMSSLMKGKR